MAKIGPMSDSSDELYHLQVEIYTPENPLRHPGKLLRGIYRDLLASRELAWYLAVRDLKAQYRQSYFGFAWAFLPPILTAVGLTLARNTGAVNIADTDLPYPAYVMFSMTLWQTFIEAFSAPVREVNAAKGILARIKFPREALILSALIKVCFNFGIKLILIVGLFLWFRMPVGWSALLAPLSLIHLLLLGIGLGLLLAPVGALYQDVQKVIPMMVTPWLLITPVIYPPPESGPFAQLVNINPVTPLLVTTRDLVTGVSLSHSMGFWVASALSIGTILVGLILYRASMPILIERMSA